MVKKLITHINPHLDDIAAIWLIKKYFSEYKDAPTEFISANTGKDGLSDKDSLYIGVGMGKYDEHKGDSGESAMSLVWKDLLNQNLAPEDIYVQRAIEEIVRWNTLIDTAQMPLGEFDSFQIAAVLRSSADTAEDSLATVVLGGQILDRILPKLTRNMRGLGDWEKRVEFNTSFGKIAAIESDNFSSKVAYKAGFDVVITHAPAENFMGVMANGTSAVDLTPIYDKLKELDPEADWFLHQSKKMILCGAGSAPEVKRTKLNLTQVIEAVKEVSS